MDPVPVIQACLDAFRAIDPSSPFPECIDLPSAVHEIETFYPDALHLIQKDTAFFASERVLFGVNISPLFQTECSDDVWKHLQLCVLASFFHGDIKEKLSSILNTVKSIWNVSGQTNDDVTRILNDDNTQGYMEELLEYASNLRSAKIFMSVLEGIDLGSLDITLDNPAELIDMVRNPEHPVMKKAIATVQRAIKEKFATGEITQHQLQSDIEGIKAKLQGLFGNIFNEALGGRQATTSSTVLMSNSPEARRQRMLARLQRKQKEKTPR